MPRDQGDGEAALGSLSDPAGQLPDDTPRAEHVAASTASAGQLPGDTPIDGDPLPDPKWLELVEAELSDIEFVLKCLSRESATLCDTCLALDGEGQMHARPVLESCAATKRREARTG